MKLTYLIFVAAHIVLLEMMLLTHIDPAYCQEEIIKKDTENCITSECHSGINSTAVVHKPVAERKCTVCHGEAIGHTDEPQKHTFGEVEDLVEICYSCHERIDTKKYMHDPADSGECTSCHDPHGSSYKLNLIEEGGALCFTCHDVDIVSHEYVHGPADAGGCLACHDPHSSDHAKNLRDSLPNLCFMCHTDKSVLFKTAKVIHKPAVESCASCHNPHSAKKKFMLDHDVPSLCFSCHKKKKEWIQNASTQHGALIVDKSCLNCHEPHASNIDKRLSMAPLDLCLSCHDKNVKTPEGKKLTNIKKLLETNKYHHGPIKQKDCSGCHNPHGSDEFRMLREKYPPSFYMSFGKDNYNLCFKCHDKSMMVEPATATLTGFRDDDRNLHFKHVNRPEKGRTCRACHETHASNHPMHIRDKVPFGNWEFSLNFIKTDTGGSCAPGCHKKKQYDRKSEVKK